MDAVSRVNERRKALVAEKIVADFDSWVSGRRIALWGLAFKPGTDECEVPALGPPSIGFLPAAPPVAAHAPGALTPVRRI